MQHCCLLHSYSCAGTAGEDLPCTASVAVPLRVMPPWRRLVAHLAWRSVPVSCQSRPCSVADTAEKMNPLVSVVSSASADASFPAHFQVACPGRLVHRTDQSPCPPCSNMDTDMATVKGVVARATTATPRSSGTAPSTVEMMRVPMDCTTWEALVLQRRSTQVQRAKPLFILVDHISCRRPSRFPTQQVPAPACFRAGRRLQ